MSALPNRPGLSAIDYRVGTYASFRQAMIEELSRADGLPKLTSRRADDYAITVLELWAAVADVLAFYQERYANEGFLGTATRPESVARLAALLDYHPAPGAAALARLSFALEPGKTLALPAGLRVQSLPGRGEQPQVYETLAPLAADARLNRLRVYPQPQTTPSPLAAGRAEVVLDRTDGPRLAAAGLAAGARVVLFKDGQTLALEEKTVREVRAEDDRAVVAWTEPVKGAVWAAGGRAFPFGRVFRLFGHAAPATYMEPVEAALTVAKGTKHTKQLSSKSSSKSGTIQQAQAHATAKIGAGADSGTRLIWHLRSLTHEYPHAGNAVESAVDAGTSRLCLDGKYDGLAVGGRLLVADTRPSGVKRLVTIVQVDQAHDVLGAAADTVTRVIVSPALGTLPDRRGVVVYELGQELILWPQRYPDRLTGDTVYLPGRVVEKGAGVEVGRRIERGALTAGVVLRPTELELGRLLVLSDASGSPVAARLKATPTVTAPDASGFCHLVLELDVDGVLDLETASATLEGNVAPASHGETVADEVVGSGDASARFQRLRLKRAPLTFVPAATEGGVESSLVLLVDGVRWHEVPGLFGRPADARVFTARLAEDGSTELRFGDGVYGSPLPTGRGNVHATYRVGLGLAGRVGAGALTTALDRPPGLLTVTNPLPAAGGADPEARDTARRNAPRTVRTFERAVSLRDFEDLVSASGEVAKAQATWTWEGLARAIHLTVAAQAGATFGEDDLRRLAATLTAARDPNHPLRLANFVAVDLVVRAKVGVDPDRRRSDVEAAATQALLAELSFDAQSLGRPVGLSDVYRILQGVPGVAFVDVDELQPKDPAEQAQRNTDPGPVQPRVPISPARPDRDAPGGVRPAELARIESPTQDVTISATGGLDG